MAEQLTHEQMDAYADEASMGEADTSMMDFKDQDAVQAERDQLVKLRTLANALGTAIAVREM